MVDSTDGITSKEPGFYSGRATARESRMATHRGLASIDYLNNSRKFLLVLIHSWVLLPYYAERVNLSASLQILCYNRNRAKKIPPALRKEIWEEMS